MPNKKLQEADELKEKGNVCVNAGNYNEAVLHYSHAIKLDPKNHVLYSNRSMAFLKLQQYFLALQDARQTIQLQPNWPKGYYRKGNVESTVGHYRSALVSFGKAMLLDPQNTEVKEAVKRTNEEVYKMRKREWRDPRVSTLCGALIGIIINLADQFLTKKPSIKTYSIQLVNVIIFMLIGYYAMIAYRYIRETQKKALLEQPVNLLEEMNPSSERNTTETVPTSNIYKEIAVNDTVNQNDSKSELGTKPRRRGGSNMGRQKFKMGKGQT